LPIYTKYHRSGSKKESEREKEKPGASKQDRLLTRAPVSTWLISAATPGVPAISYNDRSVTRGLSFMRRPRGCPIPPAAPKTATFRFGVLELDMHLVVCVLVAADTDLFNNVATDRAAIFLQLGARNRL
jgi:hypothetical protein